MLAVLDEGKEAMREHSHLRPFVHLHIHCDPLCPGGMSEAETQVDGLGDGDTCFDDDLADDGLRRFLNVDAKARDGSMAQDVMPVGHDMGNACVVEDRRLSAHPGQDAHEFLKV